MPSIQTPPVSGPAGRPAAGKAGSSRVLFAETAGVDRKLAASVLAAAKRKVMSSGEAASLKRVRFVPSSRVDVEGGFQVLANTTVQKGSRSVVLGTVVTVQSDGRDQSLKDLTIRNL